MQNRVESTRENMRGTIDALRDHPIRECVIKGETCFSAGEICQGSSFFSSLKTYFWVGGMAGAALFTPVALWARRSLALEPSTLPWVLLQQAIHHSSY